MELAGAIPRVMRWMRLRLVGLTEIRGQSMFRRWAFLAMRVQHDRMRIFVMCCVKDGEATTVLLPGPVCNCAIS